MDTETNSKKVYLEQLPKDELIKKCKGLLNVLQKAKLTKDILIEENNSLKEKLSENKAGATDNADTEMLESLIKQKVQLVTTLEETKSQKKVLENKLKECEYNLTGATEKLVNLDNENQGCRRQINRLVEENEQLLVRLDSLEKETEALKKIGVKQEQQLLKFEDDDDSNFQILKARFEQLDKTYNQVQKSNKELTGSNEKLLEKCDVLNQTIRLLEQNAEGTDILVTNLKLNIQEKIGGNEQLKNVILQLNIELEAQQTHNKNLHQDLLDSTNRLRSSENANEKLRDRLKIFHSKIVKFASDVKLLKQEKVNLLNNFKEYVNQVKLWEMRLTEFSSNVIAQFAELEKNKSQMTLKYNSLKIKFDGIEKENSTLNIDNKELSKVIEYLKSEIDNDQSGKLYSDNRELTERLTDLLRQVDEYKAELELLKCDRNLLKEQYDDVIGKLLLLQDKDKEASTVLEEMSILKQQNAKLQSTLDLQMEELGSSLSKVETLQKNIDDYKNTFKNMEDKIAELTNTNTTLSDQFTMVQNSLLVAETDTVSQKQLTMLKLENNELLAEMNEMNQVLKERGETISKQHGYCEELLKNLKLQESQSKKYSELVDEKDSVIQQLQKNLDALNNCALKQIVPNSEANDGILHEKNEEIHTLQTEIATLKEKLLHMQETSQETLYAESETLSTSTISRAEDANRLRDLEESWEERYGKLRSLALKLKGKIRDVTEQLTKEQNEKNELQQKLLNSHKIIQTLQAQCDSLYDTLDSNKNEMMEYSKKLDVIAHDKSAHLKDLANNEEAIIKLKFEIETLHKEKANTDTWKKQVSSKVQNLKRELDANLLIRRESEEQVKKLNTDLEEKSKLLNDEIEKHNGTKSLLLESHNECKKLSVLNLELQDYERSLKEFTQKLDKKQETITKLKNQVDQQKSTLSSIKEQNRLLEERIENEESDLNGARGELQTYKKRASDLETIVAEKDEKLLYVTHTMENCRAENEELSTHLSKLVADNQKVNDSLKNDKQLLHTQNSGLEMQIREMNDTLRIKEEELKEVHKEYEAYKVRAQSVLRQSHVRDVGLEEKLSEEVVSFRLQVETLMSEIFELREFSENAKKENAALILEKENVQGKLRDLEQILEEQKQLYESLSIKHQKAILENSETISSLKIHTDTLSQCYRQQLTEQEVRHNKEIIELHSKIEKVTPIIDSPILIAPSTPREQGEGSECTETSTKATHPLPLDKLLNNEMEQDAGFLRKQITEHETKVNYLTSLLADTEQDLVKHVQMNKLLKEEIRRYQRSVEREKHADNLEYLKNVVFKFATSSSGDERSCLVPVLNTILKFSPDEMNQLSLVTRGEVPGRGWADYLPMWPSGKPQ